MEMKFTAEQEAKRAQAMKEYFTLDELDIIHDALQEKLKALEPLKGYTIWTTTKKLINTTFPLITFRDYAESSPHVRYYQDGEKVV